MKKIVLALIFISFFVVTHAQCDFTQKKYGITEEKNVVYGTAVNFGGGTDTLKMNIYKPVNADTKRPILMFIHGGGFSDGNKEDFDAYCKNMAMRGYVTATISYRLGFYRPFIPNTYPYVYDMHEYKRAVYRAMQDGFGALRYLKGRNAGDSSDVDNFYIGGGSAGAITAVQMAFAHNDSLKSFSQGKIGDVTLGFDQFKREDLGAIYGNLHVNGESNTVKGVINIFGAIEDTTWVLNNKGPAIYSYHQVNDPVVPCYRNKPYHGIGLGISDGYDVVYGSCFLHDYFERKGYDSADNVFHEYNGNQHDIHNVNLVESDIATFLNYQVCKNRNLSLKEVSKGHINYLGS